jgi:hypothetical protein
MVDARNLAAPVDVDDSNGQEVEDSELRLSPLEPLAKVKRVLFVACARGIGRGPHLFMVDSESLTFKGESWRTLTSFVCALGTTAHPLPPFFRDSET